MKKLLTVAMLLCTISSLFSAQTDTLLRDSTYEFEYATRLTETVPSFWRVYRRSIYDYDRWGNMTVQDDDDYYAWDSQKWHDNKYQQYAYDEYGYLTMVGSSDSYGKTEYKHDSVGNLLQQFDYWEGDSMPRGKREWSYNENGKLLSRSRAYWNSTDKIWKDTARYEYKYDSRDSLIEQTLYTRGSSYFVLKTVTKYNSNGQVTETGKYRFSSTDSSFLPESLELREYTATGKISKVSTSQWDTETSSWLDKNTIEYEYSEDDLLLIERKNNWYNNAWEIRSETAYSYNQEGNLDTIAIWEANNSPTPTQYRTTYSYNTDGLVQSVTKWKYSNMQWNQTQRNTFSYTQNNRRKEEYRYTKDPYIDTLIPTRYMIYDYDPDGNTTGYESYSIMRGQISGGIQKYQYSFDAQGRTTMDAQYTWYSDSYKDTAYWSCSSKTLWQFDQYGNISDYQSFSPAYLDATQWEGYDRHTYTFNRTGQITEEIEYDWNFTDKEWNTTYKHQYEFDQFGNTVSYIRSDWDETQLVYYLKQDKYYNSSNQIIADTTSYWHQDLAQWLAGDATTYTYNEGSYLTEELTTRFENGKWRNLWKIEHYYSGYTVEEIRKPVIKAPVTPDTETPETAAPELSAGLNFSPNPAHECIRITGAENPVACILSVTGTVALPKDHYGTQINIAQLQKGVYLLVLEENGLKKTFRMVKQ